MKAIARTLGFTVKEKSIVRTSFHNFTGYRLNTQQRTSSSILRAKRKEMIANGLLDPGKQIVPIVYEVLKVTADGQMVNIATLFIIIQF